MAKISVIGAGVGGLSAAARLARNGHTVEIYEASNQTGGKCRTEWFGDYGFDTGPSLLTIPAVYRDLFLKTGKRLEHVLDVQPVDPAFAYHFSDGKQVTFPNLSNPKAYLEIEKSFGPAASEQWQKLMERADAMWEVSREPFIESELTSIWSLLKRKNLLKELREISPFTSLRDLTKKYQLDPHLSMIVDRYATYTGSDPRKAPAVLLTIAYVENTFGAWHISGGIGRLAQALEERCLELGVKIHLNTKVSQIITKDSLATGIKLANGDEIASDLIVTNADSEITYNQLINSDVRNAKKERRKLRKASKSLAGFSLLLGLDNTKGDSVKLEHHNVFFPQDYDAEFDQIFDQKVPVSDPTIYICAPKDKSMVKGENKEAWFVLVNAPRHDPKNGWDWSTNGEQYAKQIINKLDNLGLNVSNRLDLMKFRTPLDLQEYAMAPGGSIYGTSSNSASSAFLRASNRSKIKNLYCVGGSAHPGGGLPLVGISADIVSEIIGKA
jgi:phytoene desaturase